MSENTKIFLNHSFLCNSNGIGDRLDFVRIICLYFIYLIQNNKNNNLYRINILNNWKVIKEIHSKTMIGQKTIKTISDKEKFKVYNQYDIYNNKMNQLYSDFDILEI